MNKKRSMKRLRTVAPLLPAKAKGLAINKLIHLLKNAPHLDEASAHNMANDLKKIRASTQYKGKLYFS